MAKEIAVLPPSKELAEYRTQILGVQKSANDYEIKTQKDLDHGADILHTIKEIKNVLTTRKEEITRPLMQALASARDLFKPLELGYADAEKVMKAKMLAYQIEEDERIKKEQERIEKRVEKGTMRADTAAGKLESLGEAPTSAKGAVGKVQTRTLVKVRIVDETAIPREYLMPNMAAITEAVLRQNAQIPGVERYEEKVLASR